MPLFEAGDEIGDVDAIEDSPEDRISWGDVEDGIVRGTGTMKQNRWLPKEGKGGQNNLLCGGHALLGRALVGGGRKGEEAMDRKFESRVLEEVEEVT